jgi:glycogen operon protein
MLLAGDEISHTQRGNNNAYCQDNEFTWLNWKLNDRQRQMLEFVRRLITIYHEEPNLHRRRFFHGQSLHGQESQEIVWLEPSGKEMSSEAWNAPHVRCLGVHLLGGPIDVDEYGTPIIGAHLLLLFNADHAQEIPFALPTLSDDAEWDRLFDTSLPQTDVADVAEEGEVISPAGAYKLAPCSMAVFRAPAPGVPESEVVG